MSTPFRDILRQLVLGNARFVVVGGVAVNLHGHLRATKDLDLVIDLSPDEARKTLTILRNCGLQPLFPVNPLDFANAELREEWIEQKNMIVFQMRDPNDLRRSVDLFVRYPIDFDDLWARSELLPLGDVTVRTASPSDLITMKKDTGRWQDADDIEQLRKVERLRGKTAE
jgi:hypothetical protein